MGQTHKLRTGHTCSLHRLFPGHILPGKSHALVELVDLYPTIAAVAGLPPPGGLDGVDLSPLMNRTTTSSTTISAAEFKTAAFSEYPRCFLNLSTPWDGYVRPAFGHRQNGWGNCMSTGKHWIRAMGYSVRTRGYRYTVWLPWDGRRIQGDFGAHPLGEELYLHADDDGTDFDTFENDNVAADPAHAAVVKDLFAMAKKQWDAVPPPPSPRCTDVRNGRVERGVEIVGGADGLSLTHTPGTSTADCCQQCGATANCSYFTFSVNGGMCRFHTSVSGLINNPDVVSGALDDTSPLPPAPAPAPSPPSPAPKPPKPLPPFQGCKMEARVRYTGDLLSYIAADSERTCCTQCGKATGCRAFAFASQSLLCSCLSSVTGVINDMDSISGNTSAAFE